jgi:hypothetical protein
MGSTLFRMTCENQVGAIKIKVDFASKSEGDLTTYIHSDPEVSKDLYLWRFEDETLMVIYPKKAYDQNKRTSK